jgi:hypothetical protein
MRPLDYQGLPYHGELCRFLGLGKDSRRPHAGAQSAFRRLWAEVNGAQPLSSEVGLEIVVGQRFRIRVATVRAKADKEGTATDHAPLLFGSPRSFLFQAGGANTRTLPTRDPQHSQLCQHSQPIKQSQEREHSQHCQHHQPSNSLTLQPLPKPSNTTQHSNARVPRTIEARDRSPRGVAASSLASQQHTQSAHQGQSGPEAVASVPRSHRMTPKRNVVRIPEK